MSWSFVAWLPISVDPHVAPLHYMILLVFVGQIKKKNDTEFWSGSGKLFFKFILTNTKKLPLLDSLWKCSLARFPCLPYFKVVLNTLIHFDENLHSPVNVLIFCVKTAVSCFFSTAFPNLLEKACNNHVTWGQSQRTAVFSCCQSVSLERGKGGMICFSL